MEQTLIAQLTHHIHTQPESRIGVCVAIPKQDIACVNGDQRFSLQSVIKLIVGVAALDAIDNGKMKLDQTVTLTRKDMSVSGQDLEKLVTEYGSYTTTIKDLITRAINDSDNVANDVLMDMLGGAPSLHAFVKSKGISGINIDRDEKNLQAQIAGLEWKEEYTEPAAFEAAQNAVPEYIKKAAYQAYQTDIRDTATPKAMTDLLLKIANGSLLSTDSTALLIEMMKQTRTGPDRLRAGVAEGWQLANKTGTSSSYNGITAANNDVGLLIAPDGTPIPITVFVADSSASPDQRAAAIARVAAIVIAHFTKKPLQ